MIADILALLAQARCAETVELLVLDAKDAYWQVPLHPDERKYYCAQLAGAAGRKRYLAFTRTAQGSVGAPLAWSVIFGIICRLMLGVLHCPIVPSSERLEVYVDDPVLALRGTPETRQATAALAMLAWAVLGIELAIKKGQLSTTVNWIGASFTVDPTGVIAQIQPQRVEELRSLTRSIGSSNVVRIRDLRTYIGKAQSFASLLYTWHPFVHMMYAAVYSPQGGAPPGFCWRSQIDIP